MIADEKISVPNASHFIFLWRNHDEFIKLSNNFLFVFGVPMFLILNIKTSRNILLTGF